MLTHDLTIGNIPHPEFVEHRHDHYRGYPLTVLKTLKSTDDESVTGYLKKVLPEGFISARINGDEVVVYSDRLMPNL